MHWLNYVFLKEQTKLHVCFRLIRFLSSYQQSFSYVGTRLPGLNQYYARINVSSSRTQRSDAELVYMLGLKVIVATAKVIYFIAIILPFYRC